MYILLLFTLISVIGAYTSKTPPHSSINIVGGNVVQIEDYPYQVALILDGRLWCGGTILDEDHVLTAAHCVIFADSTLYVRAGSSVWNKNGSLHRVVFNATYSYKPNTDLSVLRVDEPFVFDKTRRSVELFYKNEEASAGTMGTAVGWGTTDGTFTSMNLRAVDLPVVDTELCKKLYKGTVIGQIEDGQICAGYLDGRGKDSCQGDSGGPFMIGGRQAGITSMGRGCAQVNSPGVLADVAYFNEWIMEQIAV